MANAVTDFLGAVEDVRARLTATALSVVLHELSRQKREASERVASEGQPRVHDGGERQHTKRSEATQDMVGCVCAWFGRDERIDGSVQGDGCDRACKQEGLGPIHRLPARRPNPPVSRGQGRS